MFSMDTIQEESKLIPIISTYTLPQIADKNKAKYSYTTEFNCGYGVADVLFYSLDFKMVKERVANKRLELKKSHVQTIMVLQEQKNISISYLKSKLPFSENYIKSSILKYLLENDVINEKNKIYTLNYAYELGLRDSIAVEAKLHDWKRGLYQAYRYKWFAEESYLAIYENYINRPLKAIKKFKKLNVGLLSVGQNGITVIYKPKKESPYSPAMKAYGYEKLLSDYFKVESFPN